MSWFTFSYHNTSHWIEKCKRCGRVFKREELNKDKLCDGCQCLRAEDVIRPMRGMGFD